MDQQPNELPSEYVASLERLGLRAAWLAIRGLTPHLKPIRVVSATRWSYQDIRPLLLQAGEMVPIELAERRVLALQNPGIAPPRLATTPSIFLGMQLILPGERAFAHRHTPAAARLVVEGTGAYTTVNGEKLLMERGDLLLTPPHHWHEHRHEGAAPVTWMDILDHPVSVPLEVSYLVEEEDPASGYVRPRNMPDASEITYTMAGLVPYRTPGTATQRYPLMRFAWSKAREALMRMAAYAGSDEPVHMMFVNPQTGVSLLETMSFSVRMLRPGEEVAVARRSPSTIFHVLEGTGETAVDDDSFAWEQSDTIASPTFATVTHRNRSSKAPAFLLQVDDSPMQYKLGFYEDEILRPFGEAR